MERGIIMCDLPFIVEKIEEMRCLDENTIYRDTKCDRTYIIEGINSNNGNEERYLIYDCSDKNNNFNYKEYSLSLLDEASSIKVFVFKNWQDEMDQYFKCYDKLNGVEKKKLTIAFENKLSLYTEQQNEMRLRVEEPLNYLEYKVAINDNESLDGYIYNFSLFELKRLFNITGKELFKKNVRKGLKSSTGEEIKKSFRRYLHTYLYLNVKNEINTNDNNDLISNLEINEQELLNDIPKIFWFKHNGITLFSYDKYEINRSGNYITLNPSKVSVINGAQTLTNFYMEMEIAKRTLPKLLSIYGIDENRTSSLLEEAHKQTFVKTIFINGEESMVKTITYGLNKQIPVLNEHILADTSVVVELNNVLRKRGMEILKEGEASIYGRRFDVLEFTKKYLTICQQPGKSKNLSKSDIEKYLNQALTAFNIDENKNLSALNLLVELDLWWKKSKQQRDLTYNNENNSYINSYGKNYFGSYLIDKSEKNKDIYNCDEQIFEIQYDDFIQEFNKLKDKIQASDFKKDDLFKTYLLHKKNDNNQKDIDIDCVDLMIYLNNKIKSNYSVSKVILDYLKENNIDSFYFRVITRLKHKCKEAFPFANSSFNEICLIDEKNTYPNYNDSIFKKEIFKEFPVFLIEKELDNDKEYINEIIFIDKFSFREYNDEAKIVYDKTLAAFEMGDTTLLPKVSDNLCFHVRPKAIDGKDTFEFTNGEQITKRTFWANKITVENIIAKYK